MRQHHFAVYVEMDDSGQPQSVVVDDSINDFGMSRGTTVYNDVSEDWEEPVIDNDVTALNYLTAWLERGEPRS